MINQDKSYNKRLVLACVLSGIFMLVWVILFPQNPDSNNVISARSEVKSEKGTILNSDLNSTKTDSFEIDHSDTVRTNENEEFITIDTPNLYGLISNRGIKIEDLKLKKYKESLDSNAKDITLLSKLNSGTDYLADFGWISSDKDTNLPNGRTTWHIDGNKVLTEKNPVTLKYKNDHNVAFSIKLEIDENYMLKITKYVSNNSKNTIPIASYGRITKKYDKDHSSMFILHEGLIGVFNGILREDRWKDVKNKEKIVNENTKNGWLGITDKYWLTSIIPDKNTEFNANFSYNKYNNHDYYISEFLTKEIQVLPGGMIEVSDYFFAGPKDLTLLDNYSKELGVELFDRAVDFGWFYFITKPIFLLMKYIYSICGNFGVAILILTVLIKLLLFPLSTKSFISMNKMREIIPEVNKIKAKYKNDKTAISKAVMELYKKNGVNPASGCLPILIQIPIFFSLYKVLFVTIDMRHAPFYGFIKDLSAKDPTNIFNFFGLIPINLPEGFISIGILAIIMGGTLVIQQKMNPPQADPAYDKIIKLLPYFFIFIFASFPAGLLIYWIWSNILSILQHKLIDVMYKKKLLK